MTDGAAASPGSVVLGGDAAAVAAVFPGDSEMARRCRAFDWAATPLGPAADWAPALRAAVRLALESPAGISLWCGPAYTLVYNDAYARIRGAKHPGALGRPGAEVWAEIWPGIEPLFAQIRAGGPPVSAADVPFTVADAEGGAEGGAVEEVWFSYALSAVRDESGAVLAVLNIASDTTDRVRAERALTAERARLADVFRQSPSFLAVLRGADNVFEFVNDAYRQIIGRDRDVVGQPLFAAIPEARGQGFDGFLGQVRASGAPLVFRDLPALLDRTPGAPREERFLDITYLPLVEADGTHDAVIAHGTDVTDQVRARREAERLLTASRAARAELAAANTQLQDQQVEAELANQQLQEQAAELEAQAEALQATAAHLEEQTAAADAERARLAGVLAAMGDAHIALDAAWRVVAMNPAAERINGRPAAHFLGRTHWEAWPDSVGSDIERHYWRAMAERVAVHVETRYAAPGVVDVWVEVDAVPTPDGGLGLFFRDVTARRQAEAERERLLAAERAARADTEAARARAEAVLASIADPFILLDRDWRITQVNDAAEPPLQTGRSRLLGRTLWDAFPGLEGSLFEPYYRDAMATGRPAAVEDYFAPLATWFDVRIYPWSGWNAWRNVRRDQLTPGDHFVCVQSVVADGRGNLWVVDPAAPGLGPVVPGGAKLVRIDVATNRVAQVIRFDERVAPPSSYVNDVRLRPDGRQAYLTDAGAPGALIVVDLPSGRARRVLDGHPSTQPEKGVVVKTDGRELRRPDGRKVEFAADGIALSPDGRHLYWKAVTGRTLYRIATEALSDATLSAKELESRVERVGESEPTDGLWMDTRGRLYLSAIEANAVKVRDGGRDTILVQDDRLRWPDTFSEGPDGTVYVTSSRIQDMSWFKPENGPRLTTQLWRLEGTGTRRP